MNTSPLAHAHEKHALLEVLGLDVFTPAEQEEMLLTLSDIVFRGSLVRIIERMDDATREKFAEIAEKDETGEAVAAFLQANVPGADAAVEETLADLAADFAALDIPVAA